MPLISHFLSPSQRRGCHLLFPVTSVPTNALLSLSRTWLSAWTWTPAPPRPCGKTRQQWRLTWLCCTVTRCPYWTGQEGKGLGAEARKRGGGSEMPGQGSERHSPRATGHTGPAALDTMVPCQGISWGLLAHASNCSVILLQGLLWDPQGIWNL